ncbi:hypothetical protein LJR220_004444 [Bradyrhizobium sp. LjRoot220]|uniref:hypothetical protein n=1 Tax=Bradyrhizobium sp. LjRoot220 TaxID=3342284 RepID=UPI003ECFFDCA
MPNDQNALLFEAAFIFGLQGRTIKRAGRLKMRPLLGEAIYLRTCHAERGFLVRILMFRLNGQRKTGTMLHRNNLGAIQS